MNNSQNEIRVFSPATVSNVSCGFDVLGFCLDSIGDEMVIRKTQEKGLKINKIEGADLPFVVLRLIFIKILNQVVVLEVVQPVRPAVFLVSMNC